MKQFLKNLFKKLFNKDQGGESSPVVVKPVDPIPEIPTREEVENFPNGFDLGKWAGIKIDENRKAEVQAVVNFFIGNKTRYVKVENTCGVPAELICALHYRESSLSFAGVLHNGERILNTGKKTKLVPKGRGPFKTWEEAAVDALMLKKSIFPSKWTFESMLEFSERFNGLGYRSKIGDSGKIELSPYVFAGTNLHDETGKYVVDGKYSPTAKEAQLGVASIIIGLNKVRA